MFQEELAILRDYFLWLKYIDIIKKCPYAKLNRYEDNVAIKMWSSCGSTYCTFLTLCVNRTVQLFLEPIAKTLVLFKVLGNLRAIFMRLTKIAKSDYSHRHICLSVRPSACINSAPTERGFHKIWHGCMFRKSITKIYVLIKTWQ
jgi:hypothetical protein